MEVSRGCVSAWPSLLQGRLPMSDQTAQKQRYMVSIYEPKDGGGALVFTFVPKGLPREGGNGGIPKRVPQFIVAVRQVAGCLAFDWAGSPDDPGAAREELEAE